ncbi:MAG: proton-conducting transporter membrane subunit [Burkholderiaceae bacterium]
MHSRQIADYGGVVTPCPGSPRCSCCSPWLNCGLPATSGFVGEFMVILGRQKFNF